VVYQSVCNLLLLEMRAKRLYLHPSYLIGLDWIATAVLPPPGQRNAVEQSTWRVSGTGHHLRTI